MAETRRKFDHDFRQGAVRLVLETEKPIAQVARELGINEHPGQLGGAGAPSSRSGLRCAEPGRACGAGPAAQGERRAGDAA
jgi:Transposase